MKYDIKKDHASIKQQIKEWELKIDNIIEKLDVVFNDSTLGDIPILQQELESISDDMCAINI